MPTKKKVTLEDLEDEIKSISRKQAQAFLEYSKYQEELQNKMSEYYEINPDFVKVKCPTCRGTGILKDNSTGKERKIKCDVCNGNMFLWMEIYKQI